MIYTKEASSPELHHVTQIISLNLKGKVDWESDGLVAGRFGSRHVFFVLYEGGSHDNFYEKLESRSLCILKQGSSIVESFSIPTADPMFKTVSYHW